MNIKWAAAGVIPIGMNVIKKNSTTESGPHLRRRLQAALSKKNRLFIHPAATFRLMQ